jgi:ATP-dependent Clp protease adaptor protein ClpS
MRIVRAVAARPGAAQNVVEPEAKTRPKVERPRMHKVILVNDDFTPREFVVVVLRRVFGMGPERAYGVMITAHRRGCCVVAVYTRDIAETKATQATEAGREAGFPLLFTTEPEE